MAKSRASAKAAFKSSLRKARDYDKAATAARMGGYERAQSALDAGFAQLRLNGSKSATRSGAHTLAVMMQRQQEAKRQQIRTGNSLGDLLARYGGTFAKAGGVAFDPAKTQAQTGVNVSAVGSRIANLNMQTAGGVAGIVKQGAIAAKASADQALANALDQRSTAEELKVLEMKQQAALQHQGELAASRQQKQAAELANDSTAGGPTSAISEQLTTYATGGGTRAGAQALLDSLEATAKLSPEQEANLQSVFTSLYPDTDPQSQSPAYVKLDENGNPIVGSTPGEGKPLDDTGRAQISEAVISGVQGGADANGTPIPPASFADIREQVRMGAIALGYSIDESMRFAEETFQKLTGKSPSDVAALVSGADAAQRELFNQVPGGGEFVGRELLRSALAYLLTKPDNWDAFKAAHPEVDDKVLMQIVAMLGEAGVKP